MDVQPILWLTVSLKLMEWVLVVWSMAGSGPEQSEVVPLILHSHGVQDATRCGSCRISLSGHECGDYNRGSFHSARLARWNIPHPTKLPTQLRTLSCVEISPSPSFPAVLPLVLRFVYWDLVFTVIAREKRYLTHLCVLITCIPVLHFILILTAQCIQKLSYDLANTDTTLLHYSNMNSLQWLFVI